MLIDLRTLYDKYSLNIKGVIHIGAYNGEESEAYGECGINKVIWIEAIQHLADKLRKRRPQDIVINEVVSDKEETVDFMITNNEASSSLLNLGTHLQYHPKVWESNRIKVNTITVDNLVKKYNIDINDYNFLNIDIQGAELKALKGMKENLKYIDYLYLEVNEEKIYEDCCLIGELDEYLTDFKRMETKMTKYGWGDSFYKRT